MTENQTSESQGRGPGPGRGRWQQIRRHAAVQTAAVYLGASWALIEGADIFFPSFGLSLGAIRWLGLILALGFVVVIVFAWRNAAQEEAAAPAASAAPAAPAARREPRQRRKRRLAYGSAALLLVLGGVFWWARPRILGAVAPAAEVIAVMPFHTSGSGVELLGEGMVDLISPNLDAVGGIRTVDARTVLHHWNQRAPNGSLDLDGALQVGRDVDAGSILWGTAIAAGSEVRLTAELYSVKGIKLASARVDGPAESVLALIDTLTLSLLRDIWVSREPVPNLRLSAITTGSVDAIRAYLLGEQQYRRSNWESAVHAYSRAVEADSSFALAHYRLANSYGWTLGLGSEPANRHARAALRFSDRLPQRERTLLAAYMLFEDASIAAHDTLLRYTARYPDDAEAWYQLGDVRFHARPLLGLSLNELYEPFERVRELDPSFAPAFIHPVELAIEFQDSTAYVGWTDALQDAASAELAAPYLLAGEAIWGPPEEIGATMERLGQLKPLLRNTVGVSRFQSATVEWDSVLAGLEAARRRVTAGRGATPKGFLAADAMSYTSLGRLAAARLAYDTLWILDPGGEDGFIVLSPLMAGLVDSTFAPAAWAFIWQENPDPTYEMGMNYLRGLLSLNLGQVAEARSFLQTGLSISDEFDIDGLFRAALALVDIVEGDTVGGVARLKAELQVAGYGRDALFLGSPLRIQLAYLQIDNPETRREGINRLLYGLNKFTDFPYIVPSLLVAAQALEEEGDPAAAARAYSLFVHHWEGADPELLPRVETARRALERLSRESMN